MKNFIKIFDERIAEALCSCGFSYIKEKINANQTVFVFEESDNLEEEIRRLQMSTYQEVVAVSDPALVF